MNKGTKAISTPEARRKGQILPQREGGQRIEGRERRERAQKAGEDEIQKSNFLYGLRDPLFQRAVSTYLVAFGARRALWAFNFGAVAPVHE